ncbi:MAG: DinB family protein [Burkholderiaceae bacterium]|nr:DinB family protein [Burkholderiaceae bacterium]
MSASSLLLSLFKYKAWADAQLLLEMQKFDPVAQEAERHTAIRAMNHVYVVDRIFAAHLGGSAHGYEGTNTTDTPALEDLSAAFAESDRWFVDYVAALSPAQLSESLSFTFTDGLRGHMSREEMLAHVITHGSNHRGAVGQIMKQVKLSPPRDVFTGFLHKSEPARREAGR